MTKTLRCAIYTRVSTDAGLEQDFNSLDAQRESAEAYIKSQTHEGWRLVRDRFDDGGYSGGSMERPALQNLLDRIRERRIDVVVVYKVDRLTRSLADFAKLVEVFDAHGVAFVSVTQAFNTTTSMGRLTLNVLLSFAQFEREVTAERIRDKIAASKKKGLWMGGVVPLGYRVEDRKLHVVEEEAAIVRQIFALYLELGSVRALQRELRRRDIRSRVRKLASGKIVGGIHFTNGPLYRLLRNRHFLGEINHRCRSWPGEHAAIVDAETFAKVQAKLDEQRLSRADRLKSNALLMGKVFNEAGERLSPIHAAKNGVRYRYYISTSAMQGRERAAATSHRLPAPALEAAVIEALRSAADKRRSDADATDDAFAAAAASQEACTETGDHLQPPAPPRYLSPTPQARSLVESHLVRVVVRSARLEIEYRLDCADPHAIGTLSVPWSKPDSHVRRALLLPNSPGGQSRRMEGEERDRLILAIATARSWLDDLVKGRVSDLVELAPRHARTQRSVRMTLSLAFLDPKLIDAACSGTLPRGYGVTRLMDLPPRFADQWHALGLLRPV
ncbi:MAG: recombinase family protein [Pseudomonadota bacterium]|nr:recombinase family protein [Pseudomonadota bacterium]